MTNSPRHPIFILLNILRVLARYLPSQTSYESIAPLLPPHDEDRTRNWWANVRPTIAKFQQQDASRIITKTSDGKKLKLDTGEDSDWFAAIEEWDAKEEVHSLSPVSDLSFVRRSLADGRLAVLWSPLPATIKNQALLVFKQKGIDHKIFMDRLNKQHRETHGSSSHTQTELAERRPESRPILGSPLADTTDPASSVLVCTEEPHLSSTSKFGVYEVNPPIAIEGFEGFEEAMAAIKSLLLLLN